MKNRIIALLVILAAGFGAFLLKPYITPNAAASPKEMEVYKSASCGCCNAWIIHAEKEGYKVKATNTEEMYIYKTAAKVPERLQSCHTTIIGDYVIEGHVPMREIKRLLQEKPKGAIGLAVPGMPSGSPGMENGRYDSYDVIIFFEDGRAEIYASY